MKTVTRSFDATLYSPAALNEARIAFAEFCLFDIESGTGHALRVHISTHPDSSNDLSEVALEFWNYVLDRTWQLRFELD